MSRFVPLALTLTAMLAVAQPVTPGVDIRVDTELVDVDVVVRDAKGPVRDLKQSDFAVFDNGKQQKISAFSVRYSRAPAKVLPLPPRTVSNRVNALGEEPAAITVILWDVLNTEWADQAWMRNTVLKYLNTLEPGNHVALYQLGKKLQVLQDFTDDPGQLLAVLRKTMPVQSVNMSTVSLSEVTPLVAAADASPETVAEIATLNNGMHSAMLEVQYFSIRDRSLLTSDAFQEIARHLGGVPGRKKVVWVSGSFPALSQTENTRLSGATAIEYMNTTLQTQKAIEALNHANVGIYPIDVRGLTTDLDPNAGLAGNNLAGKGHGGLLNIGIDTMNMIASGTGGRAYYGSNDLGGAIGEVLADAEVTYTLAFAPAKLAAASNRPRKTGAPAVNPYHKLEVKLTKERRGLELRHRKGYLASDTETATEHQRELQLDKAVVAGLDSTGVGLIATTARLAGRADVYELALTLDVHDLHFEPRQVTPAPSGTTVETGAASAEAETGSTRWVAYIDYATLLGDLKRPVGSHETIALSLTESRLKDALEQGFTILRPVVYDGPANKLRVVIQDRITGRSGSVSVPLGQ